MTPLERFNAKTIRGILPGGWSPRRVYIMNANSEVICSRALDYEYAFGNFSGVSFRYNGLRHRALPSDCPVSQGRIEVDGYAVVSSADYGASERKWY